MDTDQIDGSSLPLHSEHVKTQAHSSLSDSNDISPFLTVFGSFL